MQSEVLFLQQRDGDCGDVEGEKRLMLAVLEDAVTCFQKHLKSEGRARELFNEAEKWLFTDSDGILSFNNICDILELDTDFIRSGLEKWKIRAQSGINKTNRFYITTKTRDPRRARHRSRPIAVAVDS